MPPTIDIHRVPRLLAADVERTLGAQLLPLVEECAGVAQRLALEPEAHSDDREHVGLYEEQFLSCDEAQSFFDSKVIDAFQQRVHDEHIDTTWPTCPRHQRHPLDFDHEQEAWCCPRDGAPIADLGLLGR